MATAYDLIKPFILYVDEMLVKNYLSFYDDYSQDLEYKNSL